MEMKKNFVINAAFFAIVAALAVAFWQYLLPALTPFVIGFLVASIVQWPLNKLHPKDGKAKGFLATGLCLAFYALLVWVTICFTAKVVSEIANFAAAVPDLFYDYLYPLIWEIGDWVQNILEPIDMTLAQLVNEVGKTLASTLAKYATEFSAWAVKVLASGAVSIPRLLPQIIVTVASSCYIAADYPLVIGFLKKLIPAAHRETVIKLLGLTKTTVLAYIKSYSIMFFVTFAELWLGFTLMKVPYTTGLAFAIAFFDLMPILGVGGILLPWSAIALVMGSYPMARGVLVLYLGIAAIRNILEPRIVGKHIGLHPLATLVAMVVGLKLAGLAGMLALPISLVAIVRFRESAAKEKNKNEG